MIVLFIRTLHHYDTICTTTRYEYDVNDKLNVLTISLTSTMFQILMLAGVVLAVVLVLVVLVIFCTSLDIDIIMMQAFLLLIST
jgi:hypothetical protein